MDYKNARVYQILNTVDNNVYVGSTCQALSKRMAKHRGDLLTKANQKRPLYQKMKEIGVEHFYIELLEEYPCENKEQLLKKEGFYIRQIGTLNGCIVGRTPKEYKEEHKDKIIEFQKQYYKENKDKLKEHRKQYTEENKDKITEFHKRYREENKERIEGAMSIKIMCACGSVHRIGAKSQHLRTKKHAAWVNLQSQPQTD